MRGLINQEMQELQCNKSFLYCYKKFFYNLISAFIAEL